jgi:hypothetical protein
MEVYIDTDKVNNAGKDIMMLSNDLNSAIDEMFNRLTLMSSKTHEWVGDSTLKYEKACKVDKEEYVELKNEVYNLGKFLTDIANSYDVTVKKDEYRG